MSVNIQTKDGLKKLADKTTKKTIKNALGYTPANIDDLPDIINDLSDTFYIVDGSNNIIASFDSEGLHTTKVEVNGEQVATKNELFSGDYNKLINKPIESDGTDDSLSIVDLNGNIVASIDEEGINATNLKIKGKEVATKEDILNAELNDVSKDEILQDVPSLSSPSDEFIIKDKGGYIAFKVDNNGVYGHTLYENGRALALKYLSILDAETTYALKSELFSGSYNDLLDKPTLFSGDYNDLLNKPELFDRNYNSLLNRPIETDGKDEELAIVDKNYNVIARINESGFFTTYLFENGIKLEDKYALLSALNNYVLNTTYNSKVTEIEGKFSNYLSLEGGTISGRTSFLDELSAFELYEDNVPLSSKYVSKTDGVTADNVLTEDEILVGSDGTRKVVSSGYTVAQLIELINGKKSTFVVWSWENAFADFDVLPSEQDTYPASFTYASASTGILLSDDTYAFLNTLKNGDVFLSVETNEPDYFVSISALDGSITFHKLETDVANLVNYLTIAKAESTYAKKTELFSKNYNELTNKPIETDGKDDSFKITDNNGNVIANIDKAGINTTTLYESGIKLEDKYASLTDVDELSKKIDDFEKTDFTAEAITGLSVSGKTITYTKGDGTTGTINTQDTTYAYLTTSGLGLARVFQWYSGSVTYSGTINSSPVTSSAPTVNNLTSTSGRYYGVESDINGRLFVNVPWESGTSTTDTYYRHNIFVASDYTTCFAYFMIYTKTSTSFTYSSLATWLVNNNYSSAMPFSCTGQFSSYHVLGIYASGGTLYLVYYNGTSVVSTALSSAEATFTARVVSVK